MLISILICSIHSRAGKLAGLLRHLEDQVIKLNAHDLVEIRVNLDNKEKSTGKKRQELIEEAEGKYVIFIDDDDWVEDYYVEELLKAAESDADCFGINGWIETDGRSRIYWELSKNHPNRTIHKNGQPFYIRTTNHITGVKREIALKGGFPDKSAAEDKAYSENIHPYLQSEHTITKPLYQYHFSSHNKEY